MFHMSFHLKPFLKHGALSSFTKARTSRQKNHYGYSTCSGKPAISGLKTEKRLAVSNSKPSDSEPRQFSMFSIRQWLIFKIHFSRGLHLPTTHEAPRPSAATAGSARKKRRASFSGLRLARLRPSPQLPRESGQPMAAFSCTHRSAFQFHRSQ